MEGLDLLSVAGTALPTAAAVWAVVRVELRYLRRDVDDLKEDSKNQWVVIQWLRAKRATES